MPPFSTRPELKSHYFVHVIVVYINIIFCNKKSRKIIPKIEFAEYVVVFEVAKY